MKAREREELERADKRQQDLLAMYSKDRVAQREKMVHELEQQIDGRRNDQRRQRADEIEEERRREALILSRIASTNMCPHGKTYICSRCSRSYPRSQLTKRPLRFK